MKKMILAAAAALAFALPVTAYAAEEEAAEPKLEKQDWSFYGFAGKFDRQQLQRGLQVYREVCAACHSLHYVNFRNLESLGYSEAQVKAIALEYEFDTLDDEGNTVKRKGTPPDHFPDPYPNEKAGRLANNGALPPDLSLMAKAREGGPDYVYHLLLGYGEPPAGVTVGEGMHYNKFFVAGAYQIAMAQQVTDDRVTYADGTKASADQISRDITAFLTWAAEPKMEVRHATGIRVILFTLLFTVLAFFLKKRIWARLDE